MRNLNVNTDYLMNLARKFILEHNIEDYVSNISFNKRKSLMSLGYYDLNSREIVVNCDPETDLLEGSLERSNEFVLYHELAHAYQYKLIEDSRADWTIRKIMVHSFETRDFNPLKYNYYHDFFATEHNANSIAARECLDKLHIKDTSKIRLYSRVILESYSRSLLKGYTTAPLEFFYKSIRKDVVDKGYILYANDIDNYDRIVLGLPVVDSVYKYAYSVARGKEKVKSIDTFGENLNNIR